MEGYPQVGYCPFCGVDIYVYAVDVFNNLLIWGACGTYLCRGNREEIVTFEDGFIMLPIDIRNRYIYARPNRRAK